MCPTEEPLGDSGDGVTDGVQDTWSEGSHEKPLTLDKGSGGKTDKTYTHTHHQPSSVHKHTHTHKFFVVNP